MNLETFWWAVMGVAGISCGIGIMREAFTLFYDVPPRRTLYTYWIDERWIIRREHDGSYERESNHAGL